MVRCQTTLKWKTWSISFSRPQRSPAPARTKPKIPFKNTLKRLLVYWAPSRQGAETIHVTWTEGKRTIGNYRCQENPKVPWKPWAGESSGAQRTNLWCNYKYLKTWRRNVPQIWNLDPWGWDIVWLVLLYMYRRKLIMQCWKKKVQSGFCCNTRKHCCCRSVAWDTDR